MKSQDASYQNRANAYKAQAQQTRRYANQHLPGNIARHVLGIERSPHNEVQQDDLASIQGSQTSVTAPGPWQPYQNDEYPTGKIGNYFIWTKSAGHGKFIYNVTVNKTPPKDTEGGYYQLEPLLAQKKSSIFSHEDNMFDDDMFDDEFIERSEMKYRNINPLRENDFIAQNIDTRQSPFGDRNPQGSKFTDTSFMDDIFDAGGTLVDLGPQTQFDYSMPPRNGNQPELRVDGILGEEPMKKSVWEAQEVRNLIQAGVERGLNKAQLKEVLKYHGIINELGTGPVAGQSEEAYKAQKAVIDKKGVPGFLKDVKDQVKKDTEKKESRIKEGLYLVYGPDGNEIKDPRTGKPVLIRASGQNAAEAMAKKKYGDRILVAYTEV